MASGKRFKLFRSQNDDTDIAPMNSEPEVPLIIRFYDPNVKAQDHNGRTLDDILAWSDGRLESCHNYIQMLFPLPEGSMFSWAAPLVTREIMEAFHERVELREQLKKAFLRMLQFYGFEVEETETIDESVEAKQDESGVSGEPAELEHDGSDKEEAVKNGHDVTESTSIDPIDQTGAETQQEKAEQDENGVPYQEASTLPEADQPNGKDSSSSPESTASTDESKEHPQSTASAKLKIVRASSWDIQSRNWAVRMDHNHLRISRILRSLRVLGLQEECEAFIAALEEVFSDPKIRIGERSMEYWLKAVHYPLYKAPDDTMVMWIRAWEREREHEHEQEDGDVKAEKSEENAAKRKERADN